MNNERILPEPREVEEATRNPNGWVYRIYGQYGINDTVPPEAVVGAWRVNEKGIIVGDFILNPKFSADDKIT
ncbi:hypothetical protein [Pseudomonas jessenii]|uniref:hypothetical protein n=1 Tax=Pseudomonas jessenii TaxID=77298 RepID=UPI000F981C97